MKESEDNLENFFRNRAESNQYGYKESDWAKMEAKLEAAMPKVGPFPYSKYGWMGLGAIITALFFIGYVQFNKSNTKSGQQSDFQQESSQSLVNDSSTNLAQENRTGFSDLEKTQSKKVITGASQNGEKGAAQKSRNFDKNSEHQGDFKQESAQLLLNDSSTNLAQENRTGFNGLQKTQSNKIIAGASQNGEKGRAMQQKNSNVNQQGSLLGNQSETVSYSKKEIKQNTRSSNASPIALNTYVEEEQGSELPISEKEAVSDVQLKKATYQFENFSLFPIEINGVKNQQAGIKRQRLYTLSLLGSIDISSTAESAWGKPTFRFGVSGEYFVAKRWSIGIGVNLSRKKYQAKGTEYSPPKGFWTNGVVPDSTNAICDVLDVPVTVNYFQPINNKSSLVISGGISSWFMLQEDYWYKYKSNDPDLVSWWGGENAHQYWFGVINLSVSYEHTLTNKWSVAIGPYLNIPLSGIGHGNVELQNFGMRGALRFNKFKLSKF